MTTRRKIALLALFVLGVTAFVTRKTVTAAPQAAAPAKAAEAPNSAPSGGLSIPDTTLGVNSSTPMSQRIVHYEIDARYDATNHTIDANEVLTYHNLTG